MTWTPQPTVTIGGTDYSSSTLNGLTISYGRTNVWEQSRAAFATVGILNVDNLSLGLEINDTLTITVKDSNQNNVTLFTGSVTEISNQLQAAGGSTTVAVQTVTAVGAFAQMSRTIIGGDNWPKEYDDDRMTRIFTDSGVTIDVVDTPGVYEFTARDKNPANAYTLATSYAAQAFGYIYETKDGKVGYANESRRTIDVETNGYLDIDEGYINWRGINSKRSISDIVNRIVLFYKANAEVTSEDSHSISQFGLYEARVNTELENLDEAQNVADRYVSLRSIPETNFSAFNINLENPNLLAADLDSLLNIEMGTAFQIDNLPNAISPVTYQGFVEGWTIQIDRAQAVLNIISSDSAYSIVPIRWQDVDPTTEWDDIDPTAVKTTRTNLILNPNFEVGITGWTQTGFVSGLSRITTDSYFGNACIQCVSSRTDSGILINTRTTTYSVPITLGLTYCVSAYFKTTVGTRLSRLTVVIRNAPNGTITETFTGTNTDTSAGWTRLSRVITPTAVGGTNLELQLTANQGGAIGDTLLIDGILVTQASANDYYWDGTYTDIPTSRRPTNLTWTGTADLSTSTATAYFGDVPDTLWENVDTVGLP
jgi:hypothetical protein